MADDLFGIPLRRLFWGPSTDWRAGSAGHADWIETPSAHILKINVPGLARDEVKVQLEEGNVLHVRGEAAAAASKEEPPHKDAVWHVAERGKGEFSRRFALPDDVKADHIKAHVENGVLTVVAPKETSPPKPKSRTIAVSSKL